MEFSSSGESPSPNFWYSIPYDIKDTLKGSICWDSEKLLWYTYKYQKEIIDQYQLIYLNVPFHNKDEAKDLGAIWHSEKKRWYTSVCNNELITKFQK